MKTQIEKTNDLIINCIYFACDIFCTVVATIFNQKHLL